jgi:Putative Ig domain
LAKAEGGDAQPDSGCAVASSRQSLNAVDAMKNSLCALGLCGFWLITSSCGSVGGSRRLQPLTITSPVLPQAVLKEAYGGGRGFSVTAAGGVAPYSWTWAASDRSKLPPGLNLRSNLDGTGTIFGMPTNPGPYGVIVTVTDSESPPVRKTATYVITVAASGLAAIARLKRQYVDVAHSPGRDHKSRPLNAYIPVWRTS